MALPAERPWWDREMPRGTPDQIDEAARAFRLAHGREDEDEDWDLDEGPEPEPDPVLADLRGGITSDSAIARRTDQARTARFPSSVVVTTIRAPNGSPWHSNSIRAASVVVARNRPPPAANRPMMIPVFGVQS